MDSAAVGVRDVCVGWELRVRCLSRGDVFAAVAWMVVSAGWGFCVRRDALLRCGEVFCIVVAAAVFVRFISIRVLRRTSTAPEVCAVGRTSDGISATGDAFVGTQGFGGRILGTITVESISMIVGDGAALLG